MAEIDARLARKAPSWNNISRETIVELVDWMVIDADPDAVRVARQRDLDRHIEVQPGDNGMAEIWGSVRALVSWRQSSAGSWSSSYVAELGPPSIGSPPTKGRFASQKVE